MAQAERQSRSTPLNFPAVLALALTGLISIPLNAQDTSVSCPCFSYEEIESIFQRGEGLTEEQGMTECTAEDYSVECKAEVSLWDQNYEVIAQASVDWYDFDPSRCEYIDNAVDPGIERKVRWPHPAPEETARACFDIISSVIAKSDSSGKCNTYP
jgi:hypothetical protein